MALVLRCSHCEKHYEANENSIYQKELICPLCGKNGSISDFYAMMFCPHCHEKLAVSLDMMQESGLICPKCDKEFTPSMSISLDDEDEDFFDEPEDCTQLFNSGDFFDKYEIIRLLGKGGMGEVYLARHLFLNRDVALKVMLPEAAGQNTSSVKRFIREAKLANKIESPNLISVFDVGSDNKTGMLFISMEYVEGYNVGEIIKSTGALSEDDTLTIISEVLNALEAIGQCNVVHRDIKPSNIMIDANGVIKLADLGIAKSSNHAEGELTLTHSNAVFGTPNYASPEQCRAAHNVDCRADIYSLGATMYHMVTGKPPYDGETAFEIMLKVFNDPVPDLRNSEANLSPAFITLVTEMLAKDPSKRPQTVAELKKRIENIQRREYKFSDRIRDIVRLKRTFINNEKTAFINKKQSYWWNLFKKIIPVGIVAIAFAGFVVWNSLRSKPQPSLSVQNIEAKNIVSEKKSLADAAEKSVEDKKISSKKDKNDEIKVSPYSSGLNLFNSYEGRVERCHIVIADLRKKLASSPDNKFLQDGLNFMEKTVKVNVEQQLHNHKKAEELFLKNFFDVQANKNIQKLSQQHILSNDRKTLEQLLQIMSTSNFNPDLQLKNPKTSKNYSLLKFVLQQRINYVKIADEMIGILLQRNIYNTGGGDHLVRNFYSENILRYGVDRLNDFWSNMLWRRTFALLVELGAHVNVNVYQKASVLHWASRMSNAETVKKLLWAGADVNACDPLQQTPLFWAYKFGNKEVIQLLIDAGSDINHMDIYKKKAADYIDYGTLNAAVRTNKISEIISMLEKHPFLADETVASGETLLAYACRINNLPLVKKLIARKVNLHDSGMMAAYNPMSFVAQRLQIHNQNTIPKEDRKIALEIFKELLAAGAKFTFGWGLIPENLDAIDDVSTEYLCAGAGTVNDAVRATGILNRIYSITCSNDENKRYKIASALLDKKNFILKSEDLQHLHFIYHKISEREIILLEKAGVNFSVRQKTMIINLIKNEIEKIYKADKNNPLIKNYTDRMKFCLKRSPELSSDITKFYNEFIDKITQPQQPADVETAEKSKKIADEYENKEYKYDRIRRQISADMYESVAGRLQRCNIEIAYLKSKIADDPKNQWLQQRLAFMEKNVRRTLQKQISAVKKSQQVKDTGKFDAAATRKVQKLYYDISKKISDWVNNFRDASYDKKDLNRLLKMMENSNFDPNLKVQDFYASHLNGPLIENLVLRRFIPDEMADRMLDILFRRGACNIDFQKGFVSLWGNAKIVRYGLDRKLDDSFWLYALRENKPEMFYALIDSGFDVNDSFSNVSCLHWAVKYCNHAVVKKLLLAGANVSAVDADGQTPLFWAQKYSDTAMINLLIAAGSNPEIRDKSNKKASDYGYFIAFNNAVKKNNLATINTMLKKYPDLAHKPLDDGSTLLKYAVEKANITMVQDLIRRNVDVNAGNELGGDGPVMEIFDIFRNRTVKYYNRKKMFDICKMLLSAGAVPGRIGCIYFERVMDPVFEDIMYEFVKYVKDKRDVATFLRDFFWQDYHINPKNYVIRYKILSQLLHNKQFKLNDNVFKGEFFRAASKLSVPEKELVLLLNAGAPVDDMNGETTLFYLCRMAKNYAGNKAQLAACVKRIKFLLQHDASPEMVCGGRTVADLQLPAAVRNIPQIKKFLSKKKSGNR